MPFSTPRARSTDPSSRRDRNHPSRGGQMAFPDCPGRCGICYHPGVREVPLILLAFAASAAGAADRQLRVARYLDNRLKLAAQLRESELEEAVRGKKLTAAERDQVREQLAQEKYQRLLHELLIDLRRRASVRVLDPLEAAGTVAAGQ